MSNLQPTVECASVREELSAWMDGELGPEQRSRVDRHLATCCACQAEVALLRLISQAVRQIPYLEPQEELRGGVLGKATPEGHQRRQ